MLFTRYVLLGQLPDGSQVFWDTREDRAVKRPITSARKTMRSRVVMFICLAASPLVLMMALSFIAFVVDSLPRRMTLDARIEAGLWEDWIRLYVKPATMDGHIFDAIIVSVVAVATMLTVYWMFCTMVLGTESEYQSSIMEETALAVSYDGSVHRYLMGRFRPYALFVVPMWGIPACTLGTPFLENEPWWRGRYWSRCRSGGRCPRYSSR